MNLRGQHVLIAGAGIIGLAAALELVKAGAVVTVFDTGAAMREASWAAAGMLAVEDPENDPGLLQLARFSASLYPGFLSDVERLSGLPIPLRTTHALQGSLHGDAAAPAECVEGLAEGPWRFRLLAEASLDPRDLCRALPVAARAAGVTLREHTRVISVAADPSSVHLRVQAAAEGSATETVSGDLFLLAAGAWSGQIAEAGASLATIAPRKGQMIEVTLPDDATPLTTVLRTPALYLVPRTPHRIVIGATVEDAGFDRTVEASAGAALLEEAALLWPPIRAAAITAHWSGLRPGFRGEQQGLPLIGPLPGGRGRLWTATGHFRNGILLAPGTARLLAALLNGAVPPVAVEAFDPSGARLQALPLP